MAALSSSLPDSIFIHEKIMKNGTLYSCQEVADGVVLNLAKMVAIHRRLFSYHFILISELSFFKDYSESEKSQLAAKLIDKAVHETGQMRFNGMIEAIVPKESEVFWNSLGFKKYLSDKNQLKMIASNAIMAKVPRIPGEQVAANVKQHKAVKEEILDLDLLKLQMSLFEDMAELSEEGF